MTESSFKVEAAEATRRQQDFKDEHVSQTHMELRRLQGEIAERVRAYELLEAEIEAVHKAALSDKLVARDYINSLLEEGRDLPRLREAEQRLIAQTQELILSVQAEAAEMAALIETVQGSHFWKFKRSINRLVAKVLRR